ncbi:MAG: DUF501 domain-containing protein [Acidimicrobiia bacterium]
MQIGRPLRAASQTVSRCHLGVPVATAVPPLLDDGTPFPTRYWLTCPLACRRVGRLESAGGVKRMDGKARSDPDFASRLLAAHARYAAGRDALVPEGAERFPAGGVGGSHQGVKCLHAHYADTRAGNDNPVGEAVAPWVEPLDCSVRCVVADGKGGAVSNPDWREPT